MPTLETLIRDHGIQADAHLEREMTIPVGCGLQRQGDVIIIPAGIVRHVGTATTSVPTDGVPVVRGENGGNTHLLLPGDGVAFDAIPERTGSLDIGVLTVADGATGWLAHPEHGYCGIGPGVYVIRRQREMADEIRMVAD